jgi:hypothetical protein
MTLQSSRVLCLVKRERERERGHSSHAYICNYFVLLDDLINTREDVEFLVEKGIIVNALGSNKAVAIMVNKLGLEIVEQNSY